MSVNVAVADVAVAGESVWVSGAPPSTISETLPVGATPAALTVTVTTPFAGNVTVGALTVVVVFGLNCTAVVAVAELLALFGSDADDAEAVFDSVPFGSVMLVITVSVNVAEALATRL